MFGWKAVWRGEETEGGRDLLVTCPHYVFIMTGDKDFQFVWTGWSSSSILSSLGQKYRK